MIVIVRIEYARRSLEVTQALAASAPDDVELKAALADRWLSLAVALDDAGVYDRAIESDRHALDVQQQVAAHEARNRDARRRVGVILADLSEALEDSGDYAAALDASGQSRDLAREVLALDPANARSRREMWDSLFHHARQLAAAGETEEALREYNEAIPLIEGLAGADPTVLFSATRRNMHARRVRSPESCCLRARHQLGVKPLVVLRRSRPGKLARHRTVDQALPLVRLFAEQFARAFDRVPKGIRRIPVT